MTRRGLLLAMAGARADGRFLPLVRSHLEALAASGTDRYGAVKTGLWMASLDIHARAYPEREPMARAGRRVYRDIASPFGSNLYWDIPQLVAADAVSRVTGDRRYSEAAASYIRAFLATSIDRNGVFEWGNHRYYDAFADKPAHFVGGPHEMRPISPCWDLLWLIDPRAIETEIRQSAARHVFDPASGGFNRHDDGRSEYAFLEAGGILAESLAWLHAKTRDAALIELALKIARFSFGYRGSKTGLVENSPMRDRWDKYVSTTEVGLWAGCLLRAAAYSGRKEFEEMAAAAVAAYLRYGWDGSTRRYYGQLRVADGSPVLKENPIPGHEEYWPGNHADIWNANFPSHDYPMAMATTCVELYRRTKAPVFAEAIPRWAAAVDAQPVPQTAANGRGAYAELFGRAIQFLAGAARATGQARYRHQAETLAQDACRLLYAKGMFRGHAGEDRYDAVDGVGYLLLALIGLETDRRLDYRGFGF